MRSRLCWAAGPLALYLILLVPQPVSAEREPFRKEVFPPELVIKNQRRIELTPEQRETFIREMQATQSDLLPIQLEMSDAGAALMEQLEASTVDEAATLAAAERVLELERQTKLRHMVLLVRIKNLLTLEQQRMLRQLRERGLEGGR